MIISSNYEVSEKNVRELVKGGRARWKIENEGFNTLKNHLNYYWGNSFSE